MASLPEDSDTDNHTSPTGTTTSLSAAKTSKSRKKRLVWRLRCRGRIAADYEVSEHFPDSESDVDNSIMAPPTSNTSVAPGSRRVRAKDMYLFVAARSDGKLQVPVKNKPDMLDNCPTSQQLDQNRPADAKGYKDYFRELPQSDPRNLNWRVKLGFLFAEKYPEHTEGMSVVTSPKDCIGTDLWAAPPEQYCFAAFPDNYRLYEHVRIKVSDGTKVRSGRS